MRRRRQGRTEHRAAVGRSLRRRCGGLVVVVGAIAATACSSGPADRGFATPAEAARAFAPGDLPDVEPWSPAEGRCRILLVGDSLTEAVSRSQVDAFEFVGCEAVVDGLTSRSLSEGWQCRGGTSSSTLRTSPEPGNRSCRPSGLQLLRSWSELAHSASAVVIALGTNDAGMYSDDGWIRRWNVAATLTKGPLVFVTAAARPGDPWAEKVDRYNSVLRSWCATEQRCALAEWDLTEPARNPDSYTDHVHLTRAVGEMRAVFIAAVTRRHAIAAPPGPDDWKAPVSKFPDTVRRTEPTTGSSQDVPIGSDLDWSWPTSTSMMTSVPSSVASTTTRPPRIPPTTTRPTTTTVVSTQTTTTTTGPPDSAPS